MNEDRSLIEVAVGPPDDSVREPATSVRGVGRLGRKRPRDLAAQGKAEDVMPPPRLVGAAGRKKKKAHGQAPTSGEGVDANADAPTANEVSATASEREEEADEATTEFVDHRPHASAKGIGTA